MRIAGQQRTNSLHLSLTIVAAVVGAAFGCGDGGGASATNSAAGDVTEVAADIEDTVGLDETTAVSEPADTHSAGSQSADTHNIDDGARVPDDVQPGDSKLGPADSADSADSAGPPPDVTLADALGADVPSSGDVAGSDAAAVADTGPPKVCGNTQLSALYEKRIKPLVSSDAPSSCNGCHLSGVSLKIYVQPTPCATMACLIAQGMVDLNSPTKSKILAQIKLSKPQSDLIDKAVQDKEYAGFLDWIKWAGACQTSTCGVMPNACNTAAPATKPVAKPMLGMCTEPALVAGFEKLVWPHRNRCSNCHTQGWKDKESGPPWMIYDSNEPKSATYTMYQIIGKQLLNLQTPEKSKFLLKPLVGKLGGIDHDGGDKFETKSDPAYVDFLAWIKQYAGCHGG